MGEKLIGNVVRDLPYWTMQATPSKRAVNAMIAGSNPASPTMKNWRLSTKLIITSCVMIALFLPIAFTPIYDSMPFVAQGFVLIVGCLGVVMSLMSILVRNVEGKKTDLHDAIRQAGVALEQADAVS